MSQQAEKKGTLDPQHAHEDPSALLCETEVYENRARLTLCASFMAIPMYIHALAQPLGSIWTSLSTRYSAM